MQPESFPDDAQNPLVNRLYMMVVGILGLIALIGTAAWFYSFVTSKRMPEGLVALTTTIIGGFIGLLVPQPVGRRNRGEPEG